MSERHGGVPGWLFAITAVALLLLPAFVAAAVIASGGALFLLLYGFIGAGGAQVGLMGLVALAVAVFLSWLSALIRASRKTMVRYQRMLVGSFMFTAAPLTTLMCFTSADPMLNRANWIVTGVYMLFGLWYVVDAWEDRWSL